MVDLDSTKNAIKKLVEKYNTLEKEGKLKDYKEELEEEIKFINRRIDELSKNSSEDSNEESS